MQSRYCLHVAESLDPAWTAWLENFIIERNADGTTTLIGIFTNQEKLFDLLHKMGELGMTLLAVEHWQDEEEST